jgi:hypothetical protein
MALTRLVLQRPATLWGPVHAIAKFACLVCTEGTNSCLTGQTRYSGCLITNYCAVRVCFTST